MYHDQVSDRGQMILHKIATAIFPDSKDRLMQAAAELPPDLPNTAYADPAFRRFPCHTKAAVLRSAAYLYGQQALGESFDSPLPFEKVAERLDRAAAFFGVKKDVDALREDAAEVAVPKEASVQLPPEAYAIDELHDGRAIRRFPMFNPATIAKAAGALIEYRFNYPYPWRKKAAMRVLQAAMSHDLQMDPVTLGTLTKMAGLFPNDPVDASRELLLMSERFRGDAGSIIRKVANAIAEDAAAEDSAREEVCTLIDKVAAQLMPGSRPMVEDAMYSERPVENEKAPESVTMSTGNIYDVAALMQAPQDTYRVLGDDVAASLLDESGALDAKKVADVLPTLPRPEAQVLDTALSGVSIMPRTEEKSAGRRRGAASMGDDYEGWSAFLKKRGSKPNSDFRMTAPLRHDLDVHDHLTVT